MTETPNLFGLKIVTDPALPANEARLVAPDGTVVGRVINIGEPKPIRQREEAQG